MKMDQIKNAVILASNTHQGNSSYDTVYGGETLLNRCLIAMSKSGITSAVVIAHPGCKNKIEKTIEAVKHRLMLDYRVTELSQNQILSEKIMEVSSNLNGAFLMYKTDKFMHPTFFKQAVTATIADRAVIFAHKNVIIKDNALLFEPAFKEKFKVIFSNPAGYNKITVDQITPDVFKSNPVELTVSNRLLSFAESGDGVVSADVIACSRKQLESLSDFGSIDEAVKELLRKNKLAMQFVADAWWMRITPEISKSHIKDLIWKIAFKEISGEFSKAVNSKMSKPLSFYFARKGVTPNVLSNVQLILFLIASGFLLIDAHWAMIVFAVLWQFSAGVLDRCDGEVARIRNHESEAGGRFDMIIDDMRNVLPFTFLGGLLYYQTQSPLYAIAFVLTFVWFIALTLYEQDFMRKAGYTSRQVMYVDYKKLKGENSHTTSLLTKFVPIISGDIRTFYVFLLALFGLKEFVFWVLLFILAFFPVTSFVGILKFKKESLKK
ncbi:CDP-alcohol phosphatidyltransferase family protein [bacterium]|nr:MAG: CDP-alcohol phosphatidyltransferase family protein [bacterium]